MASWTEGLVGVSLGPRGRYRLNALIDEGGMAAVFEASDANLRRGVAIKLIRPALRDDPGFARRFEREARTVAGLDHAHILPVLDFGETMAGEAEAPPGLLYLVMRLVRGTSLRRRLASGQEPLPWKPEQVLSLVRQVLPALDYAHRRGIIHRDFKPENVLLEPAGDGYHAFLADFGLARAAEGDADLPRLTQTGQILGTPFYMAPEQWLGDDLDARTDEYAVGVLMYELLTGEVPYQASMPMAVGQKHLEARLPPPRTKNASIPEAVAQVVTRALARDPAQRFPTCLELLTALTAAVEHDPSKTFIQPMPPVPPVPLVPPVVEPRPLPTLSRPVVVAAAGVLSLVVLAFVARQLVSDPGGSASPTPTISPPVVAATASATARVVVAAASPSSIRSPVPVAPAATSTSIPIAAATATRTSTPAPTPGPSNPVVNARGTLRQAGTNGPIGQLAGVRYRDVLAEARIDNPRDASGRPLSVWDYGLAFRWSEQIGEYRLFVASAGTWSLELGTFQTGRPENIVTLDSGSVRNLNTATDGSNTVRVLAIGDSGYFFVNDEYVAVLDLSGRGKAAGVTLPAGDVAVAGGYFDADRVTGAVTTYSSWNVSPFTFKGEVSATPTPHPLIVTTGGMDSDAANVKAANVVVTATFMNPDALNGFSGAKWDFGFIFRKVRQNEMYRLVITADDSKWWVRRVHHEGPVAGDPTPTTNDYRAVTDGTVSNIDTDLNGWNDLFLIAVGNVGHFFLNDTYVGKFSIADILADGDVEIGSGFFANYTTSGRTLQYNSFNVWAVGK